MKCFHHKTLVVLSIHSNSKFSKNVIIYGGVSQTNSTSFIPAFCQEVLAYWRRKTTNFKFFPNFLHFKHMRLRGVGMTLKWVDSLTWATLEGGTFTHNLADFSSGLPTDILRSILVTDYCCWKSGRCLILGDVFQGLVHPSWKAGGVAGIAQSLIVSQVFKWYSRYSRQERVNKWTQILDPPHLRLINGASTLTNST